MGGDKGKQEPGRPSPWAFALWPLGCLFLLAGRLRVFYYRRLSKPLRLAVPVISVGNLTFGGTGKTPVTIELARMLERMGLRPAVLLRGYGRATRGARTVGPDSRPDEVGEEALLLARNLPGVTVSVGERREDAAALVDPPPDVFLLDDGFQHVRVHRDLDLLLVDASRPGDLHAPPVGRLRETVGSARRADALIATRGDSSDLPRVLASRAAALPILGVRFKWMEDAIAVPGGAVPWTSFEHKRVAAFAGIGNPEAFFAQARARGCSLVSARALSDHAFPTQELAEAFEREATEAGAEAVLTTEKDAVKWGPIWSGSIPLLYPVLRAEFDDPDGFLERALQRLAPEPA